MRPEALLTVSVAGHVQPACLRKHGSTWFAEGRWPPCVKQAWIFIPIPRTGGTSIARVLYGRNLPHVSLSFYRSLGDADIAALPSIAIVRSPVDRIVSSYRFLRAGGTSLIASSRYDPVKLAQCGSFETFLEALARRPELIRRYDALRPQTEYVTDSAGQVIADCLYRFDEFASLNQDLSKCLGGAEIALLNESTGEPVSISTDARRLVQQLYGADVKLYEDVCDAHGRVSLQQVFRSLRHV